MQAMDGAAKCLEALRLQQKICNCRPLEFNTRLLELCTAVGAKVSPITTAQWHELGVLLCKARPDIDTLLCSIGLECV